MKVKTIGKVIIDGQKFSDVNIDGANIADELTKKLKNINISKKEVSKICKTINKKKNLLVFYAYKYTF